MNRQALGAREVVAFVAALSLGVGSVSTHLSAQRPPFNPSGIRPDLVVLPVQGNVFMIAGAGANVTVQVGDEGVIVVDSGAGPMNVAVLTEIQKLSKKPVRVVINTNVDADHIGGNADVAKGGRTLYDSNNSGGVRFDGAVVMAHERALDLVSAPTGEASAIPAALWPGDTFNGELKTIYANGEGIELRHQPPAHTSGDLLVYFRRSDVVSAGDVYTPDRYPMIDLKNGGTIQGTLDAINNLLDLTVPAFNQQGGTLVVPGHGRISNESDVVEYRDMATIVRDRVRDMIRNGMTLEQVKAARPSRDYDGIYGTTSGPWTTSRFVEAVYTDLSRRAKVAAPKPAPQSKTRKP